VYYLLKIYDLFAITMASLVIRSSVIILFINLNNNKKGKILKKNKKHKKHKHKRTNTPFPQNTMSVIKLGSQTISIFSLGICTRPIKVNE